MDNVYCDGSEDEIAKCRFDGWGVSDCGSNEAAGVICLHDEKTEASSSPIPREESPKARIKDTHQQGIALRLFGGRVHSEGQVEIKLGSGGNATKNFRVQYITKKEKLIAIIFFK